VQHPESDVRTWQAKVFCNEVANSFGWADFRDAFGFMHQRQHEPLRLFDEEDVVRTTFLSSELQVFRDLGNKRETIVYRRHAGCEIWRGEPAH
jgi:hypothetical protein